MIARTVEQTPMPREEGSVATAFEAAFRAATPRLYGLAVSIVRDAGEAEDAVQETAVRAWQRWPSLRDQDRADAWLARICVNQCLDRHRAARRAPAFGTEEEMAAVPSPAGVVDLHDEELDRACRALSPRQRAVVTLHYHFGYTLDECGPILGCRPGAVRSHLSRALASLRRTLTDA